MRGAPHSCCGARAGADGRRIDLASRRASPAGSATLIVALGILPHLQDFVFLMAVLALTVLAFVVNRAMGIPYPVWQNPPNEVKSGVGRTSVTTARRHRLSVRTSPFQGGKTGSIPVGATKKTLSCRESR